MVLDGARVILVPAAFNMTTGPAHWEVLFRSRAVDNQVFTFGTAPARDMDASYHSWGHSIAVSPWGTVLNQMDAEEGMQITSIDLDEVEQASPFETPDGRSVTVQPESRRPGRAPGIWLPWRGQRPGLPKEYRPVWRDLSHPLD